MARPKPTKSELEAKHERWRKQIANQGHGPTPPSEDPLDPDNAVVGRKVQRGSIL